MDYDNWALEEGMQEWDYAHCLPYFKKMEDMQERDSDYRGKEGPLHLEKGPGANPLFRSFLSAAEEAGYPLVDDLNGYQQEGFSYFDRNIKRGRRWSAARAYYHPIKNRRNLKLMTNCLTTGLKWENGKVVGITLLHKGTTTEIRGMEIILAAGAINTPQLLLLSGIGPKHHLEEVGVKIRHPLEGVGENLQDHLEVYVQYK